jgi:endoglucanase
MTETRANEAWVDFQFQKMKLNFVDMGIPVLLGEYGVISRADVSGHEASRINWNEYVTNSALDHGMVPIYWDNGYTGNQGMGLFNRSSGDPVYPDLIDAILEAPE